MPEISDWIDIKMPEDEGEGSVSVVANWLKGPGDAVRMHEPLVELDTDKISMEVAAPAHGILQEILKREGENVAAGEVLGRLAPSGVADEQPRATVKTEPETRPDPAPASPKSKNRAHLLSPAVRRLISKHSLDPSLIQGSGRDGRITPKDVLAFLARPLTSPLPTAAVERPKTAPPSTGPIPGYRVPHDSMRRRIAARMVESLLKVAPHVTCVFEMDLTAMMVHRAAHKADFEQRGVRLTYTAYFVAASVVALRAVPRVNSRWHEDALEIFEDMNIGVGTALQDKGLIVPVIHGTQHLGLFGIASKLGELTAKARACRLSPAEVRNGTFTISNHGVGGSLIAAPIIINQPQSAILGIGKVEKRVRVAEIAGRDTIQILPMAYVTLSIDHRALDAFQTNAFLAKFVEAIETWQ